MAYWPRKCEAKDLRVPIFYRPKGDGRDGYISCDNGGTTRPIDHLSVAPSGTFMRFGGSPGRSRPTEMVRTFKYHADGSGRDQFISYTMADVEERRVQRSMQLQHRISQGP